MVAGFELCNAYSEQNDAAAAAGRLRDGGAGQGRGRPRGRRRRLDYVRALEYGMPCTGGLGIGIDRLVMLLSEADNIREVILFPTMRPEAGTPGPSGPPRGSSIGGGLGRLHPPPDVTAAPSRSSGGSRPVALAAVPDQSAPASPDQVRRRASASAIAARSASPRPRRAGRARRPDHAADADPVPALAAAAVRQADRAGLVSGHRPSASRCSSGSRCCSSPARWRAASGGRGRSAPCFFALGIVTNILKGPHPDLGRVLRWRMVGGAAVLPPAASGAAPIRRRCCGCCGWPRCTSFGRAGFRLHQPGRRAQSSRRPA